MRRLLLGSIFLLALVLSGWVLIPKTTPVATVAFLDIGQGDAIYIESPSGVQMLIDGGPDPSVLSELSKVMPWLDRSVDIVAATHPDSDHIGGLISVLRTYRVNQVITSGSTAETDIFKALYEAVSLEDSVVSLVRRGTRIDMGAGMEVEILFPEQVFEVGDRNVNSLVVRVTYGENSWLLTGDIGIEQEEYLVDVYGDGLRSDVLKLGHHGSKTSSSQIFLDAVQPELAIISAGKNNKYNHPAPEVVARVADTGVPMLATFDVGTIITESDGLRITTISR